MNCKTKLSDCEWKSCWRDWHANMIHKRIWFAKMWHNCCSYTAAFNNSFYTFANRNCVSSSATTFLFPITQFFKQKRKSAWTMAIPINSTNEIKRKHSRQHFKYNCFNLCWNWLSLSAWKEGKHKWILSKWGKKHVSYESFVVKLIWINVSTIKTNEVFNSKVAKLERLQIEAIFIHSLYYENLMCNNEMWWRTNLVVGGHVFLNKKKSLLEGSNRESST